MGTDDLVSLWAKAPELAIILGCFVLIRVIWQWAQKRDADNQALVKALNESFVALLRETIGEFRTSTSQSAENGRTLEDVLGKLQDIHDLLGDRGKGGGTQGQHRQAPGRSTGTD